MELIKTEFIAKSKPVETIRQHTDELRNRYEVLEEHYRNRLSNERMWDLLKLAVDYHDAGKIYGRFQSDIKKAIGIPGPSSMLPPIPHNYLSPLLVPLDELSLTKEERKVLIQAITYHHERDHALNKEELVQAFQQDLLHYIDDGASHLNIPFNRELPSINRLFRYMSQRIDSLEEKALYNQYVLVKGLLHRLDHAASAHVEIECDTKANLAGYAEAYLGQLAVDKTNSTSILRPLQQFAKEHHNMNLILVAQTGMGKTEAALLWAEKKKTFFTLPLRVSINALFSRVQKKMRFFGAGLLHSSSANYLDEQGIENWEIIRDQSKHLSSKLLFTTIDQILKFPFKYKGYEKHYATMAYSAVVIDEIQAYEPKIAAVLIKALEMIHEIGGSFLVMTATLPQLYLETLEAREILTSSDFIQKQFVNESKRHRIQVVNEKIEDDLERIYASAEIKKVLVIVNTVKKAVQVYEQLAEKTKKVRLLHSMFVQKHRASLEEELLDFDLNTEGTGIWVTTQLVEASIDIDFDELYTEAATLDSLCQRFGRCYRRRELEHQNPNVFIYTESPSGKGSIYDEEIVNRTVDILLNYQGEILNEKEKVELVKELYKRENLKETKFLTEFEQALREIDAIRDSTLTDKEAQKLLRNIQAELVIPRVLYDEHIELFEQLEEETNPEERAKIRRIIETYTLSVRKSLTAGLISPVQCNGKRKDGTRYSLLPYISIIDLDYDFDKKCNTGKGLSIQPATASLI